MPRLHDLALNLLLLLGVIPMACRPPSVPTGESLAPGPILSAKSELSELQKAIDVTNVVLDAPGFEHQVQRFIWKNVTQLQGCMDGSLEVVEPGVALTDIQSPKSFYLRLGRFATPNTKAKTDLDSSTIRVRASRLRAPLCSPNAVRPDLVNTLAHESVHLLPLHGGCFKYVDTGIKGKDLSEAEMASLVSYRTGDLAECFLVSALATPSCANNWPECGVDEHSRCVDALVDACMAATDSPIVCLEVP